MDDDTNNKKAPTNRFFKRLGIGVLIALCLITFRISIRLFKDYKSETGIFDKNDLLNGIERPNFIIKLKLENSKDIFILKSDGFYHMNKTFCNVTSEVLINGESNGVTKEIDTELPIEGKGEYNKFKLTKKDGDKIYLIEEVATRFEGGYLYKLKIESELEFVKGDWNVYKSGKDIVMRYSEDGLKHNLAEVKKSIEKETIKVMSSMNSLPSDLKAKCTYKETSNATLIINKDKIIYSEDGTFKYEVDVD